MIEIDAKTSVSSQWSRILHNNLWNYIPEYSGVLEISMFLQTFILSMLAKTSTFEGFDRAKAVYNFFLKINNQIIHVLPSVKNLIYPHTEMKAKT